LEVDEFLHVFKGRSDIFQLSGRLRLLPNYSLSERIQSKLPQGKSSAHSRGGKKDTGDRKAKPVAVFAVNAPHPLPSDDIRHA
jgi:hypothetical protein